MKTIQDLKLFVRGNLVSDLKILEAERKILKNKLVNIIIIIIITNILFLTILSFLNIIFEMIQLVFVVISLSIVGYVLIQKYLSKEYVKKYKQCIIKKLIAFINPSLHYQHEMKIPMAVFNSSLIFLQKPEMYEGDDYVSGKIDGTNIEFSELSAKYTTGSGKNKRTITIFKGIFLIADFPKTFKTNTVVLPDSAEKTFGFIGKTLQSWNKSRGQLVRLEDPEFEKHFVVYADDQVEARYILSTSLMQRILDFKNRSKRNIYISFTNNSLYLAIKFKKDLFEPTIFGTLINFHDIQEYFEILQLIIGITHDLKLNSNIWSKKS